MLTTRYRTAEKTDVTSTASQSPREMLSRLFLSFLILGCGIFGLIYWITKFLVMACLVAGSLFLLSAVSIIRYHFRIKKLENRLAEPNAVEVLEVRSSRVFELGTPLGPAICFELADGQMLLLRGQWLFKNTLYRAPDQVDDGNQERFNLADDPFGFPTNHFALHRWHGEEQPFWIEILGPYQAPEELPVLLPTQTKIPNVKVFTGKFVTLQEDVNAAFGQKRS